MTPRDQRLPAGFTMIELMVVVLVVGLITAMVAPNLEAFVPKARIEAATKVLIANVDHMRSEARIQGKRCSLQFDLDHARWRRVFPPEERLTTEQDIHDREPQYEDWSPLEEDVRFVCAGNPTEHVARSGIFELAFDTSGFTGDQSIVLRLESDPSMVWTISIRGLTGQCSVDQDFEGREHLPEEVGEGAF